MVEEISANMQSKPFMFCVNSPDFSGNSADGKTLPAALPSLIIILWETINCSSQYGLGDAETKSSDLHKAYGKPLIWTPLSNNLV